jgi:hypothetical protein
LVCLALIIAGPHPKRHPRSPAAQPNSPNWASSSSAAVARPRPRGAGGVHLNPAHYCINQEETGV